MNRINKWQRVDFSMHDLANLVIDEHGRLMITTKNNIPYREVTGIRPSFDITKECLFNEFLGLISEKNYNEAIIFTYKYEI